MRADYYVGGYSVLGRRIGRFEVIVTRGEDELPENFYDLLTVGLYEVDGDQVEIVEEIPLVEAIETVKRFIQDAGTFMEIALGAAVD